MSEPTNIPEEIDEQTEEVAKAMVVLASSSGAAIQGHEDVGKVRDPLGGVQKSSQSLESLGMSVETAVEAAIFGFVDAIRQTMTHLIEFDKRRAFVLESFDSLEQVDEHQKTSKHPLDRFSTAVFYRAQGVLMAASLVDIIGVVDDVPGREKGLSSDARVVLKEYRRLFKVVDTGLAGYQLENKVSVDDENEVLAGVLDEFVRQLSRASSIGSKRRSDWAKRQVKSASPKTYNLLVAAALQRKANLTKVKARHDAGEISDIDAQNAVAKLEDASKLAIERLERSLDEVPQA